MKRCFCFLCGMLLTLNYLNSQNLATPDQAKKAVKVILKCSKYSITENDNTIEYNSNVELTIQQIKKGYTLASKDLKIENELLQINYCKLEDDSKPLERWYIFYNKVDSLTSPSYSYYATIGENGTIKSTFKVINNSKVLSFEIDKCVFITKDGTTYNYYCDRTYSLENDLLLTFFKSMKIKREGSRIGSFFNKIKSRK